MAVEDYQTLAAEVIEENRYLALGTTDGTEPWVAPIEFLRDEDGTFYYFSTGTARHSMDLEENPVVSAAIYGEEQPEYAPGMTAPLRGVQIRGRASKLDPEDYPELVSGAIDALDLPMPPYEVFALEPETYYVPLIEDGVNARIEVELDD